MPTPYPIRSTASILGRERAIVAMVHLLPLPGSPRAALTPKEIARHAVDEAKLLGGAPVLRVDAVKALQQRWQAEAHAVPIDRRLEQKLWDAFRKPIDEAFERKTQERQRAEAALGEHDRLVLEAAKGQEGGAWPQRQICC
jgi:hypothetical protein